MKLKDRIKTTSFWAGLIGAIFLALGAFGVDIGDETASAVINAVCSVLVVFGVVSAPQSADADASGDLVQNIGDKSDESAENSLPFDKNDENNR